MNVSIVDFEIGGDSGLAKSNRNLSKFKTRYFTKIFVAGI